MLTGNKRFRSTLLGKLVLQVEVVTTKKFGGMKENDPPVIEKYKSWKDASIVDLQELEQVRRKNAKAVAEILRGTSKKEQIQVEEKVLDC